MYGISPYLKYQSRSALHCRCFSLLILAIMLSIVFCSTAASGTNPAGPNIEERVDQFIAALPDEFNGTILLAIGDTILMNKGYGWANRTYGIPNTSQTAHQIASMTKNFTAVLTIQLMREGLLDLHTTIDHYLPNYPKDKAEKITISHLLHHKSGVKQHFNAIEDYFRGPDITYHTPREYLELFAEEPLAHEPGEGETYTTLGYWVLGIILEQITGRSYAELLHDYIFEPLGMNNTFVENNLTIHEGAATGYKMGLAGYVRDRTEEPSNITASGDIVTTVGDLFSFNRALARDSEKILSEDDKTLLPRSQVLVPVHLCNEDGGGKDTLTFVGLGTGSNYGFRSRMSTFLEKDACYIVLSNVHKDRAMGFKMYRFLENLLLGELGICIESSNPSWDSMLVSEPIAVSPESLQAYTGSYRLGRDSESGFIIVFQRDGTLHYQMYYDAWGAYYAGESQLVPIAMTEGIAEFRDEGNNDVYVRFYKQPSDSTPTDNIIVARDGQLVGMGQKIIDIWELDANEYSGKYHSIELQKMFTVDSEDGKLKLRNFLGNDMILLTPLKDDLFGSEQGFFIFERYHDGTIRHFRYRAQGVDNYLFGSMFTKR
jgi:CubicO group peptidase (beta-lactamase class C family)